MLEVPVFRTFRAARWPIELDQHDTDSVLSSDFDALISQWTDDFVLILAGAACEWVGIRRCRRRRVGGDLGRVPGVASDDVAGPTDDPGAVGGRPPSSHLKRRLGEQDRVARQGQLERSGPAMQIEQLGFRVGS